MCVCVQVTDGSFFIEFKNQKSTSYTSAYTVLSKKNSSTKYKFTKKDGLAVKILGFFF